MATIENKHLKGPIGTLSASSWKGIDYVRTKPVRIDFKHCSAKELGNRKSFAAVNKLAKYVKSVLIKPIWDVAVNDKMSGYNWFIKQNKRAYNSEGELIDPRMLKLTVGNLPLPLGIAITSTKEDNLIAEISWENPILMDSWYDKDELVCILFINDKPYQLIETDSVRKDQKAVVELPIVESEKCCVFVFFRNPERNKFSDSFGVVV